MILKKQEILKPVVEQPVQELKPTERLLFKSIDIHNTGKILKEDLIKSLNNVGIRKDDPRISSLYDYLYKSESKSDTLNFQDFCTAIHSCAVLIEKSLKKQLIIPEFNEFQTTIQLIYDEVKKTKEGKVASYIPQLAKVSPDKFGISICTVNRVLRSEPAVANSRTELHRKSTLIKYRAAWQATVSAHPDTTAKSIRLMIPSTYAWLYRNDQKWLLTKTQDLPSGRRGNYSNIDWHERDCELADLVINTLTHRAEQKLKLHKTDIFTLVPALSRSLEKKCYYLTTRKLLSKILQDN